ncbi:MAG: hypothetical protein ABI334_05030 [Candidatus Dormiibacterota bacterium]
MADQHVERRHSDSAHRAAYAAAKAAPTEYKPRLITASTVQSQVHGVGAIGQFNTWLAVRVTRAVGTMWTAYLFAVIAVISLPAAILTHNTIIIVSWIAQTFFQLVLLPIIIVGQNVISASQDARAEADHLTLTTLHAMNVKQLEMLEQQREILKQQQQILDAIKAAREDKAR